MSSDRALSLIPADPSEDDWFTLANREGDEYLAMCTRNERYHCSECFAFIPTAYAKAAWSRAQWHSNPEWDYDGPTCPSGQGCNKAGPTSRASSEPTQRQESGR